MAAGEIDNFLLISSVEQNPVLWDNGIELYKNRVATQTAWQEIMLKLKPDLEISDERTKQSFVKLIIQRWTHIRDNFNRSRKKIQDQKRSGNGSRAVKPYVYSKQLRFLQKLIRPTNPARNMSTESNSSESENSEEFQENDGSEIDLIESTDNVTKSPIPQRIQKRSLKNDVNPVGVKIRKESLRHEPQVGNRHLSFFNGILPSLDDFDDNEVLEFQMGVLQLLKNIRSSRRNHPWANFGQQLSDANSARIGSIKEESGEMFLCQ